MPDVLTTPLEMIEHAIDRIIDEQFLPGRRGGHKLGRRGRSIFPGAPEDAERDAAVAPLIEWRFQARLRKEREARDG